jgi:hypothetical protein
MKKTFNYAELTAAEKTSYIAMAKTKGFTINKDSGIIEDAPDVVKKFTKEAACTVVACSIDEATDNLKVTVNEDTLVFINPESLTNDVRHNILLNGSSDAFLMSAGLAVLTKPEVKSDEQYSSLLKLVNNKLQVNCSQFVSSNDEYGYSIGTLITPVRNPELRMTVKEVIEDLGIGVTKGLFK